MLGSHDEEPETATCPACGRSVDRSNAREYDKHGDRWERRNKEFEYLCKACHDELCLQGRDGLESMLCEIDAGERGDDEFLRRYARAVQERESVG